MKQLILCLLLLLLIGLDATVRMLSPQKQASSGPHIAQTQELDENAYYDSQREPGN